MRAWYRQLELGSKGLKLGAWRLSTLPLIKMTFLSQQRRLGVTKVTKNIQERKLTLESSDPPEVPAPGEGTLPLKHLLLSLREWTMLPSQILPQMLCLPPGPDGSQGWEGGGSGMAVQEASGVRWCVVPGQSPYPLRGLRSPPVLCWASLSS